MNDRSADRDHEPLATAGGPDGDADDGYRPEPRLDPEEREAARRDELLSKPIVNRPPSDDEPDSVMTFLRELPVLLLVAFVLAFLLRTFVVQVFYIPSQSMEPTLQVNDRMVVEKITYRFRDPRRGEVVVFEGENPLPEPAGQNGLQRLARAVGQFLGVVPVNARDFVKRVIGLPGDEIVIEDGVVLVNGDPIDEPYVVYEDERSNGPFQVPEGKLFVLGDNRPNSSDSRFTLGYIDIDNVVGRALVIIWPFSNMDLLTGTEYHLPAGSAAAVAPGHLLPLAS